MANGVVFSGPYAYDATGTVNCSGTPTACTPLVTLPIAAEGSPIVIDGLVYVTSFDSPSNNLLLAFSL